MPLVTAQPRGQSNEDVVTEFVDSVGTGGTTWTYPKTQNYIKVNNDGSANITVSVGSYNQVIQRGKSWNTTVDFTSITIQSASGVQQVSVRTMEIAAQLADLAKFEVGVWQYGAVGDGTTDDTTSIYKAINALPNGGTLSLERGKTYIYSKELPLNAKTILKGNGATLKRINEVRTTTTTVIASTTGIAFSFGVASVAGLRVGMRVMLINGTTYSADNFEIKSIVGNTVEVYNSRSGESFPIGSYVQTASWGVKMADDCVIEDIRMDGNKANQTTVRWDHHQEIVMLNRCVVRDCYVSNAPAEGIMVEGNDTKIIGNYIDTCGGNGIHFSGAYMSLCQGNTVKTTNQTAGVGHEDGAIVLSNLCGDLVIDGNYMYACKSGIGSVDYDGNSDLTITNNIIRNASTMAFDIERYSPNGAPKNLIIKGNRVYNSVYFGINNVSADLAYAINNVIVSENYFYNTDCRLVSSDHVIFESNIIDYALSNRALQITNVTNSIIKGNLIKGGTYGIYIQGTSTETLRISDNNLYGQTDGGIRFNDVPSDTVNLNDNTITNLGTALSTYNGIILKSKVYAHGNTIKMAVGQFGILGDNNSYIEANVIKTPVGVPSIKTYGGTTGIIMMNNKVKVAIENSGGAGNTDVNNIVISS